MTDSGLHLIDHWPQETMGEVVAMGTRTSPFRSIAHDLARRLDSIGNNTMYWCDEHSEQTCHDAATMLRDLTPEIALKVGDTVLFAANVGQELTVDGETVLM